MHALALRSYLKCPRNMTLQQGKDWNAQYECGSPCIGSLQILLQVRVVPIQYDRHMMHNVIKIVLCIINHIIH